MKLQTPPEQGILNVDSSAQQLKQALTAILRTKYRMLKLKKSDPDLILAALLASSPCRDENPRLRRNIEIVSTMLRDVLSHHLMAYRKVLTVIFGNHGNHPEMVDAERALDILVAMYANAAQGSFTDSQLLSQCLRKKDFEGKGDGMFRFRTAIGMGYRSARRFGYLLREYGVIRSTDFQSTCGQYVLSYEHGYPNRKDLDHVDFDSLAIDFLLDSRWHGALKRLLSQLRAEVAATHQA